MTDTLASRLREERERLKLTQVELAKLIEPAAKSGMMVSRWERGVAEPWPSHLATMDSLGFDIKYLIVGTREIVLTN